LDISYNLLRKIEGLDELANLEKLFLCANKIKLIENLENQKCLQTVELGCNRICMIEGLESSKDTLEELYLGRNRLESLKGIEIFTKL